MAFNFRKSFVWNKQGDKSTSQNPRWSGRRNNDNAPKPPNNTFSPFGNGFSNKPTPPKQPMQPTPPNTNNTFGGGGWNTPNNSNNQWNKPKPNYSPFKKSTPTPPLAVAPVAASPSFGGANQIAPKKVGQPVAIKPDIRPREAENGKRNMVITFISLVFGILAVVGVFSAAQAIEAAKPPEGIQLFPTETRSGNDYIGILFLAPEPDEEAGQAFIAAAERWSEILLGSEVGLSSNQQVTTACGNTFPAAVDIDHLRIFSTISPDEVGGTLASAGPCGPLINNQATFGSMNFDALDIPGLVAGNRLEEVVLHEMGHVLGIGTFWSRFGLILNSLPSGVPNLALAQPEYTGSNGILGFQDIGGSGTLLIENGFTNGISNNAGAGSTNGHFDQDSAVNELMTFQISNRGSPLSLLTARSLLDLGLSVDLSKVDAFNLNSVVSDIPADEEPGLILYNDIAEYEIEET